jgi:hypothetical protein
LGFLVLGFWFWVFVRGSHLELWNSSLSNDQKPKTKNQKPKTKNQKPKT